MTGPGFSPVDLEKKLTWQNQAQKLLGRKPTQLELKEMELCYGLGWTPEEYATTMVYKAEQGQAPAEALP